MKVRMITLMAGPAGVFQPGAVVDFPKDQADQLISGGYAELVEIPKAAAAEPEPAEIETASLEVPEKAVTRSRKPTRKRGRPRKSGG